MLYGTQFNKHYLLQVLLLQMFERLIRNKEVLSKLQHMVQ